MTTVGVLGFIGLGVMGCGIGFGGGQCLSLAGYVRGDGLNEGVIVSGGHGPQGTPVYFPDSHSIPTSIPTEFTRSALGQDEIGTAIQMTPISKVRRVGGSGYISGVTGPTWVVGPAD